MCHVGLRSRQTPRIDQYVFKQASSPARPLGFPTSKSSAASYYDYYVGWPQFSSSDASLAHAASGLVVFYLAEFLYVFLSYDTNGWNKSMPEIGCIHRDAWVHATDIGCISRDACLDSNLMCLEL